MELWEQKVQSCRRDRTQSVRKRLTSLFACAISKNIFWLAATEWSPSNWAERASRYTPANGGSNPFVRLCQCIAGFSGTKTYSSLLLQIRVRAHCCLRPCSGSEFALLYNPSRGTSSPCWSWLSTQIWATRKQSKNRDRRYPPCDNSAVAVINTEKIEFAISSTGLSFLASFPRKSVTFWFFLWDDMRLSTWLNASYADDLSDYNCELIWEKKILRSDSPSVRFPWRSSGLRREFLVPASWHELCHSSLSLDQFRGK